MSIVGAGPDPADLGSLIAGRYTLVSRVGTGGMGVVYRCVDPEGRAFALKILRKDVATDEFVQRFRREARLGVALNSPHLVAVLDAGYHDGLPFLVMPFLEGYDAAKLLARVGILDPEIAVRIAIQACDGLALLHDNQIVHRDIKPSNLFLAANPDRSVVVKVHDFGVAKSKRDQETQLTKTGQLVGSLQYMSREQLTNGVVDERTDIWSMGVTLYRLLSGRIPYECGDCEAVLILRISTEPPTPIHVHAPWVDPGLADVLSEALQCAPEDRIASVRAFAERLSPFAGGSANLTLNDLQPISEEKRLNALPRSDRGAETTIQTGSRAGWSTRLHTVVGHMLGDEFKVQRLIGRGGMGAVFEVRSADGRMLAAKVIDPQRMGEGETMLRRFAREAQAATGIDHHNVVKMVKVGHDDHLRAPFLVMELLSGVDLGTLYKQWAPLEPAALIRLFIQAASGLGAAHAAGIIHRDIKPGNLFAHVDPATGDVTMKICDFGIAKHSIHDGETHELTQTGGMLGSPMYMSPEQAVNAKHVDHRTDIWSLGVSLYEGLTGRKVWGKHSTLGEIIIAICTSPVPPIRTAAPWLDEELANVIHRALDPSPADRWSSVEQFAQALEPFAATETVVNISSLKRVSEELIPSIRSSAPPASFASSRELPFSRSVTGTAPGKPKKATVRRTAFLLAAATILIASGALVFGRLRATSSPLLAGSIVASTPVAPPSQPVFTAWVEVSPANAPVRVNNTPAERVDGGVVLTGGPGEKFTLQVSQEGRDETVQVVLSNDGRPVPARVEIRQAATETGKETADKPNKTPKGAGPAPNRTSSPATTPAPTAPPPAVPSFRNTW